MVAIENQVERVRHLSVEAHSALVAAHLLHAAHPLVLGDDDGTCVGSQCINLHHELGLVEFRHLGAEDG